MSTCFNFFIRKVVLYLLFSKSSFIFVLYLKGDIPRFTKSRTMEKFETRDHLIHEFSCAVRNLVMCAMVGEEQAASGAFSRIQDFYMMPAADLHKHGLLFCDLRDVENEIRAKVTKQMIK